MTIMKKYCVCLLFALAFFLTGQSALAVDDSVLPGDTRTAEYLPMLSGKRVAIFCNHTAKIGEEHFLDMLSSQHVWQRNETF